MMTTNRLGAATLAAMLALPLAPALAQGQATPAMKELAPVTIHRTKNPGDLRYAGFLSVWRFLTSILPPEPRVLDLRYRLSFTGMPGPERDAYAPGTWAVAIVGDSFDRTIAVERGGYFVLPELDQALKENATIMFNAQTRRNTLDLAWKFRIGEGQTLSYADFARAFTEARSVQERISEHQIHLREEKNARFDGLKACFHPGEGRIDIDGQAVATTRSGSCQVLLFDPAMAKDGQARIRFVGPLDTVTLHETGT